MKNRFKIEVFKKCEFFKDLIIMFFQGPRKNSIFMANFICLDVFIKLF